MDSNINSLLVDIYHDFLSKRNKLRIDYDEINSELMIVNEKINLSNKDNNSSDIFSPRSNINKDYSIDSLLKEKNKYEDSLNDLSNKISYYNNYIEQLKVFINMDDESDNIEEKPVYNLNLNYSSGNDLNNKLVNIKHKINTCIKIFDNDYDRSKSLLINIEKAISDLIKE